MRYDDFRRMVEEMVAEIPPEFMEGMQGVHVLEETRHEEGYSDVYRMGEYLDPGPEQFLSAGEGLGRHIAIYHGSFLAISEGDPEFDWEEEAWETLTHELRHHVESLAGDASLIYEDECAAQDFERQKDRP
jgi:predicted Zn-dependent protease with MMP-like domain